jgi:hypothetical protein
MSLSEPLRQQISEFLAQNQVVLFDIRPNAALLIYKGEQHVVPSH